MPNVEWDVAQSIVSPFATLDLNAVLAALDTGNSPFYLVKPDGYQIVPGKYRAVVDSVSQADGSSLQPPFVDGLVATLTVEYWVTPNGELAQLTAACAQDVREMHQTLMGVLNSLRVWTTDPNNMQRYLWTPTGTGGAQRMLTNVLLASWPVPSVQPNQPLVSVTFELVTPFPYAIDATEIDTVIDSGASAALVNAGNAAQDPVMRVAGPTSGFTITNSTTGQEIIYDASRLGAVSIASGHFAEIDFFQGSIFLDGDGADLSAGLDPENTDLFPLEPGSQTVGITGANVTVLSNAAWV